MKDLNELWRSHLTGKRVLITGGTTGIGREITFLLTYFGANCLICGREQQPIEETIQNTKNLNYEGSCLGISIDLTKSEEIERLFIEVDNKLGGLDILINNAALGFGSVIEGNYTELDHIIKTNLTAYLACSHYAVKRMISAGSGHILNIGSMSADVREKGSSVYVATKSGIQGFSEALRKELNSKNIKVTLIEPGAVDTDMQPGSAEDKALQVENLEMMPAEDIAMAVAFCLIQHKRCDIVNLKVKPHLQII